MALTRKAVTAAAVVTAVAALAACGSSSASTPPAAASAAAAPVAANPVPLLVATGATPGPGEVLGSTDVEGDRYASGSYPGGEQVTVYTFTSAAAQAADLARNGIPGDAHAIIQGHLANYYVTAVDGVNGYTFTVSPDQIAARVKGEMVGPVSNTDEVITKGYEQAEAFLSHLGFTGHDVTDIVITRNADAGQRREYVVSVKALGNLRCTGEPGRPEGLAT